jgi:N-acetylneuraminic acid mutarotase
MKLISPWIRRWASCLLLLVTALLPQAKGANDFVATGSMVNISGLHTATLLNNGKVLVTAGQFAELYDPVTGLWSSTGSMSTARRNHVATLLANGKVLVTGGGLSGNSDSNLSSAELYDPVTGLWNATGSMANARLDHTATLLANGKVLVAGGSVGYYGNIPTSSAELYDPSTGLWSTTGTLVNGRNFHTATLLVNGKVLIAGGQDYNGRFSSSELYDPATGRWSKTGSMATDRMFYTATLLPNGKVLVAGGDGLSSAELYDPATGLWSMTGSMVNDRRNHTATLLVNGKLLVAGGYNHSGYDGSVYYLSSAELYDPVTEQWSATGSLANTRHSHTATLLANGKVLVAGGAVTGNYFSSAELFNSTGGDYFYSVLNGMATITAYRGKGGAVTLPTAIEGFPVTSIDNNAFYGNTTLTSVTIPASITSIGNQAFYGCTSLTSLSLPERFLTDIEYIGLSGQLAATILINGIGDQGGCLVS